MRKKNRERGLYVSFFTLWSLRCHLAFSWQCLVGIRCAAVWDHGHNGVCMVPSVFFPFSLFLTLSLRALFHRTTQRILTNFTIVPRAFKRWNRVYCLNHRSYMSLLCNCINHLLSKTLKRKIEAIILVNEVNALGTTDGWNMVCYLSCLPWTSCFTVLMWIVDTNKHNQRQPHTITSQTS